MCVEVLACGLVSSGEGFGAGVAGAGLEAFDGRSLRRIRPEGPVPTTLARSTPSSRATLRASGLAKMRSPLCALVGVGDPSLIGASSCWTRGAAGSD